MMPAIFTLILLASSVPSWAGRVFVEKMMKMPHLRTPKAPAWTESYARRLNQTWAGRAFVEDGKIKAPQRTPKAPSWAESYMVEFVVSMPSMYLVQPQGLSIPVKAWYDGHAQKSRVDSFGGIDSLYLFGKVEYSIHPRIDRLKCWRYDSSDDVPGVHPILPDIRKWHFAGPVVVDGVDTNVWKMELKQGEQVSSYFFYTAADSGYPITLHMMGRNLVEGSHFDEYLYDFKDYQPVAGDPSPAFKAMFDLPDLCHVKSDVQKLTARHWLSRQTSMLVPSSRVAPNGPLDAKGAAWEATHAAWSLLHPRAPAADASRHQQRLQRFTESHAKVSAHNARPDKTYTMQLGKFADWSEEEYLSILMPDAWRRKQGLPGGKKQRRQAALHKVPHAYDPIAKFKRRMKKSDLPKEMDWRGSGVDAGVKDQGYCGSCWAFAAVGTMEGAWFLATGQRLSFSEQQLVDCAFEWGVEGCDGGEAEPAINFVSHSAGGIALEQDYFYLNSVDFCRSSNFSHPGRFAGFLSIESRDEAALMEAVYTLGPVAVGVDASLDSFGFYKEGIYSDKRCSNHDLDHAVVLYGWGTSEEGSDYWLVKNSWSKLYGDEGFIKIARGSNDCGTSTQASVAVVARAARER